MAFSPASPLTLNGLDKFLSIMYHRIIENAVYLFVELELADRMVDAPPEKGLTLDEILGQDKSTWNAEVIIRILRCCVDVGVVSNVNDEEHFILTESGKMLVSNHPSQARNLICLYLSPIISHGFGDGADFIRSGNKGTMFDQVLGNLDFYTYIHSPKQAHLLPKFNGGMSALSLQGGDSLVRNVPFDHFEKLVDIGGNQGTYLAQILKHYPSIQHGIVFDVPPVIDVVDQHKEFRLRGINEDKYSFVGGNMFDSSTIPYGDAYILKLMLHNYNNEKVIAILSAIAEAHHAVRKFPLTIFIVESIIIPGDSVSTWQIHAMDFLMASGFSKAQVRTVQEHELLLKQAGFKIKQLYPIRAPNSVIEAVFDPSD